MLFALLLMATALLHAQRTDPLLTLDRIYNSSEFRLDRQRPVFWVENGDAFVTIERSENGEDHLIKYVSKDNKRSLYLSADEITPEDEDKALRIEDFTLSSSIR